MSDRGVIAMISKLSLTSGVVPIQVPLRSGRSSQLLKISKISFHNLQNTTYFFRTVKLDF